MQLSMRHLLKYSTLVFSFLLSANLAANTHSSAELSLNGFRYWITGHDPKTIQLIPDSGNNGLTHEKSATIAHVKFNVAHYAELSFPLNVDSLPEQEARGINLSNSKFVKITYKANHPVILQLRQTGVHGGVQNHITLAVAKTFVTYPANFSDFTGGLKPLDLRDIAKFNFAFLSNNEKDGFAELIVKRLVVDNYKPKLRNGLHD